MDFGFDPEQEEFRRELREFIRSEPPERFPSEGEDEGYGFGAWSSALARRLGETGWIGLTWPKEYGGQSRPVMDLFILFQEMAYARAPMEMVFYTETVGEAIIKGGSEEIKRDLLLRAAAGTIGFWEGFSEPNAGSDLLSLTTTAVEDGDSFVVNGQKIWNSNAHRADYGFTAVRTDPQAPRHKGISLLLVDMKTPGISVNPITDISGGKPFAEVFFDDVRIPRENLIGELNKGLPFILGGLEWDRFWGRCGKAAYFRRLLDEMVEYCRQTEVKGKSLAEDPLIRDKLAGLATEIEICRLLFYRPLHILCKGEDMTWETCWAKVYADELGQRFTNAAMEIFGLYGQLEMGSKHAPFNGEMERLYLVSFGQSLAGGTSEIARNTVATRGLGLPRG